MLSALKSPTATKTSSRDTAGMIAAIDKVMAVIEFNAKGEILTANANFSAAMGYGLDEIRGQHHRMFADPAYAASDDYRRFWAALNRGEFQAGEFKRFAKGGREIWLQASYNPIVDGSGRVVRIVKFATDITAAKHDAMDAQGQLAAINRSQAVIEFKLDGTILTANANFLGAVGYSLDDIRGQHHRMFVDPKDAASIEYRQFWEKLQRGEFQAAEYRRLAKGGRSIWIQASYNPIHDADGRPVKVVKYATDITAQVERRLRNEKLSTEIERDLSSVTGGIATVSRQAQDVGQSATEANATIQSVAAAAEELSASVAEIASSVAASKRSVDEAHSLTTTADTATSALTKTAQQMSGIVELIDDIAAQINLLALNATIESARAGEAGRGFAVVASEVKTLAAQVSSATKTISAEIQGVQAVSGDVASALKTILGAVSQISGGIASVAAAVEQQSSATSEISATMQTASGAIADIDKGVNAMAGAMGQASASASQVRTNMQALVA